MKQLSEKEINEKNRALFEDMYEKHFGKKIKLSPATREDNLDGVFVLNYYGIKSPWL